MAMQYRMMLKLLLMFNLYHLVYCVEGINKCGSETQYKNCHLKFHSSVIKCQFVKGHDFKNDVVPITRSPGPAKDLNVSVVKDTNHIIMSWNLPHDSSISSLEGFLLKVTFVYKGKPFELLRTFKIDFESFQEDINISEIIIKYACIGAFPQTMYHVQLLSYPQSIHPSIKETDIFIPNFKFNVTPETNISGDWKARMWSTIRSEGGFSSLTVCFFGAPSKFSMGSYYLFLFVGNTYLEDKRIVVENVAEKEGKEICDTFENLKNNIYSVELLPIGPDECRCEFMLEGRPVCYDACSKTIIGPIEVKATIPEQEEFQKNDNSVTPIIIIFLCLAMIVILVVSVIFYMRRLQKYCFKISETHEGKVLIVIMNNLENHLQTLIGKHLEKNLFNISYFDLSSDLNVASQKFLPDKIQVRHQRYLVIHRRSASFTNCQSMGVPDMSSDPIMENSLRKIKARLNCSEVCVHSLQLKSGSDPKVSLLKIIDEFGKCSIIVPPDIGNFDMEDAFDEARVLNISITSISELTNYPSPSSSVEFDSGLGQDSMT